MPGFWYMHMWLAASYGQLDQSARAREALEAIDQINPAFKGNPLRYLRLWFKSEESVQHFAEGLRKAGLAIPAENR